MSVGAAEFSLFLVFGGRSKGSHNTARSSHHFITNRRRCFFFLGLGTNSTGEQKILFFIFIFENRHEQAMPTNRSPGARDGVVLVHSVFEFLQGLARVSMCTARLLPHLPLAVVKPDYTPREIDLPSGDMILFPFLSFFLRKDDIGIPAPITVNSERRSNFVKGWDM